MLVYEIDPVGSGFWRTMMATQDELNKIYAEFGVTEPEALAAMRQADVLAGPLFDRILDILDQQPQGASMVAISTVLAQFSLNVEPQDWENMIQTIAEDAKARIKIILSRTHSNILSQKKTLSSGKT